MDSTIVSYLIGGGGAAGLALLLILLGVLVPKPYHDRALDQARRLQDANDVLSGALANAQQLNDRLATSGDLTNRLVTALITVTGHGAVSSPDVQARIPDPPAVTGGP